MLRTPINNVNVFNIAKKQSREDCSVKNDLLGGVSDRNKEVSSLPSLEETGLVGVDKKRPGENELGGMIGAEIIGTRTGRGGLR